MNEDQIKWRKKLYGGSRTSHPEIYSFFKSPLITNFCRIKDSVIGRNPNMRDIDSPGYYKIFKRKNR